MRKRRPGSGLLRSLAAQGGDMLRKTGVRQWLLASLVFLALLVMIVASQAPEYEYSLGDRAEVSIQAEVTIENRYRTEALREEAARRAEAAAIADEANYKIAETAAARAEQHVTEVFSELWVAQKELSQANVAVGSEEWERRVDEVWNRLHHEWEIALPRESVAAAFLLDLSQLTEAEGHATDLAVEIVSQRRISEDAVPAVRQEVVAIVEERDVPAPLQPVVVGVVQSAIEPNLVLDQTRVEQAREEARARVEPITINRGDYILREGTIITEEHLTILEDLGLLRQVPRYSSMIGIAVVIMIILGVLGVYLYQHHRDLLENDRLLPLLALLIVVVAGLAQIAAVIPDDVFAGTGFLIPVALGSMLIAILLDSRLAMMSTVTLALIAGVVMGQDPGKYVAVSLISGFSGVFSVSRISQRGDLTRAGLIVGGTTAFAMIGFGLAFGDRFMVTHSFLGLVNGIVSAIGAIGLLPYLESLFGVTSAIRLLELSNPNQPLMRRLLMEAPGTYHHSMIVGNLSEAAAEATGGDSLLVRVGSYYHDIGKIKRPYFFVENQFNGSNPHDKYSPHLSTLIITAHVRDGVELAREYRLPEVLIDFIRTHHGDDLVKYFYNKALEQGEHQVDEETFRYPGPKPQTKETAIVMLADSVEAAARAMKRPTPGRIESLVRRIIKERLEDGQLDESPLTLKDLHLIGDAFINVLNGIYHQRIEYPEKVIREIEARKK